MCRSASTQASDVTNRSPRIRRIAVASERRPKVEAVRNALTQIAALAPENWSDVEVLAHSIDSGVSATPLSDDEMRRGARQRAVTLQRRLAIDAGDRHPPTDGHRYAEGRTVCMGLEGGVHIEPATEHVVEHATAWLRGWAFATDGDVSAWGCGPSIALPTDVAMAVRSGEDLALVIDRVAGETDVRSRGGTWGVLTRDLVGRAMTFELAVLAALAPFYNPDAYASH